MANDPIDWALRIKEYRQRNNLTQEAMAEDLGVDRTTIIRWEKGRDKPALMYHKKILALTPVVEEGVLRGIIDFIDNIDGFATLMDADFRVLRTTRKHQRLMGYDPADLYGKPSQPYWSEAMESIIKHVGGLKGYRANGIHRVDLTLVRKPGEGGFSISKPLISVGRTTAIGDPRNPICHLTTLRVIESANDEATPPNMIIGLDGEIPLPSSLLG